MITKLQKHDNHQIMIFKTRNNFTHSYALRCCECNKHIQWLSAKEAQQLINMGVDFSKETHYSTTIHNMQPNRYTDWLK